jgi:hypothetical protein
MPLFSSTKTRSNSERFFFEEEAASPVVNADELLVNVSSDGKLLAKTVFTLEMDGVSNGGWKTRKLPVTGRRIAVGQDVWHRLHGS